MAVLTVRTARVEGGGAITCRFCSRQTRFEGDEWLEFIEDGHTLACTTVHNGLVVLHDCRRPSLVWQCPTCGLQPGPVQRRRRRADRRVDRRCSNCGDIMRQVRDGRPTPD